MNPKAVAKRYLVHYFKQTRIFDDQDYMGANDMTAEIEDIVELIIKAAKEEIIQEIGEK